MGAASPPSPAGASVCHGGFPPQLAGIIWPRAAHGSLLSPEPAVSSCTQFQVLLPKARRQWACGTAAAVTPWLGTATSLCAFVCGCVPHTRVHLHAHLWVCLCPWACPCLVTGHPTELCHPILGIHWGWQSWGPGAGFWKLWTAPTMAAQKEKQLSGSHQSMVVWWVGEVSATQPWVQQPCSPPGSGPGILSLAISLWRLCQLCTPTLRGPCLPPHAG